MKKILAIDFGTKRVGLAISYESLAEPYKVLPFDENIFTDLAKIVKTEDIEQLVVGLSEGEMAEKTRQFIDQLKKVINIPIVFFDETLSSNEVEKRLKQKGIKKSKRIGQIDHFAAALILERWLEDR